MVGGESKINIFTGSHICKICTQCIIPLQMWPSFQTNKLFMYGKRTPGRIQGLLADYQ